MILCVIRSSAKHFMCINSVNLQNSATRLIHYHYYHFTGSKEVQRGQIMCTCTPNWKWSCGIGAQAGLLFCPECPEFFLRFCLLGRSSLHLEQLLLSQSQFLLPASKKTFLMCSPSERKADQGQSGQQCWLCPGLRGSGIEIQTLLSGNG